MRRQKFACKRNWSWLGFGLAKFGGVAFLALAAKLVNKWSYGFCAILVGNRHKCIENEVSKVWLQKVLILVGFGLTMFGGLTFFAMVAKLVNKWSYGFSAILVGNCHKCIKNEVWKVWLQKELILVRFWVSQVRWIGFFFPLVATLVNKCSCGFCAILVGNCHKCIKNEVWKVWLQKELIFVGFWLSQVRWNGFFCFGCKIGESVKLWFLCNLGEELSHMHKKWGVKSLVAKGIDLDWVLA